MRNWTAEEDKKAIEYIVQNGFKKRKDLGKAFIQLASILGRTPSSIEKRYYRVHSKKIQELTAISLNKKNTLFSKIKKIILNIFSFKKEKKESYLDNVYKEVEMMIENQKKINKNNIDNNI